MRAAAWCGLKSGYAVDVDGWGPQLRCRWTADLARDRLLLRRLFVLVEPPVEGSNAWRSARLRHNSIREWWFERTPWPCKDQSSRRRSEENVLTAITAYFGPADARLLGPEINKRTTQSVRGGVAMEGVDLWSSFRLVAHKKPTSHRSMCASA